MKKANGGTTSRGMRGCETNIYLLSDGRSSARPNQHSCTAWQAETDLSPVGRGVNLTTTHPVVLTSPRVVPSSLPMLTCTAPIRPFFPLPSGRITIPFPSNPRLPSKAISALLDTEDIIGFVRTKVSLLPFVLFLVIADVARRSFSGL